MRSCFKYLEYLDNQVTIATEAQYVMEEESSIEEFLNDFFYKQPTILIEPQRCLAFCDFQGNCCLAVA